MTINIAKTDGEIAACFPVMRELRPHLRAEAFIHVVRDLESDGYRLAALSESGRVMAVAGFRILRALTCDKFLYVDDLVTLEAERSKGYGRAFLNWLEEYARQVECAQLHLDSGMQRTDAHRFYQTNGVNISGYHFRIVLDARQAWQSGGVGG